MGVLNILEMRASAMFKLSNRFHVTYVQGQSPEPKVREYFYYIDHQGMLFLDDSKMKNFTSCFKEKKFLQFFFRRITFNKSGRYEDEFPFVSHCGKERNFIRCDDVPIVYTHLLNKKVNNSDIDVLSYAYVGDSMTTQLIPEKIFMLPETGRVYHPAEDKYGGVGLIRSKLSIELSKHFNFENGESKPPTHIKWNNQLHKLDHDWFHDKVQKHNLKINMKLDEM